MDIPALADLTPEQTAKAAEFLDILKGAQAAGKEWWAESQLRQIDLLVAANKEIARLRLSPQKLHALADDAIAVYAWCMRNKMKRPQQIEQLVRTFEVTLGYRQAEVPTATEGERA